MMQCHQYCNLSLLHKVVGERGGVSRNVSFGFIFKNCRFLYAFLITPNMISSYVYALKCFATCFMARPR